MPGAPGTQLQITGTGAQVFAASQRAKFDLTQLSSLADFSGKMPYLRSLIVSVTLNVTNGAGSSQTLSWQNLYSLFGRIEMYMQGHVFLDLLNTGMQSLRYWEQISQGKLPELSVNQVVASSATVPIPLLVQIPMYDQRNISPEDDLLPLGLLLGASLELDWCPAAQFGSNFTINAATQINSVTAEIILRDDTRFPALWTLQERTQSAAADYIDPARVLFVDVFLENPFITGQTFVDLTNNGGSTFTQASFTENGLKTADALSPDAIIAQYNQQQLNAGAYFATVASGKCDGVPFKWLPLSSGKKTHLQAALNKPYLKLTTSLSSTQIQLLLHYYEPIGPATVADMASKMNLKLPSAFKTAPQAVLAAKSPSKQPISSAKSAFLTQKLYRRGVPALAAASKTAASASTPTTS